MMRQTIQIQIQIQNQKINELKKQEQFSQKIDELNQETDNLLDEFDKWQT